LTRNNFSQLPYYYTILYYTILCSRSLARTILLTTRYSSSEAEAGGATAALEARVTKLERVRYKCPKGVMTVDDSMRRARAAVEAAGIYSARWKWVPPQYYDKSLADRAKMLHVASTKLLCKSLLLENKKIADGGGEPNNNVHSTNPKFVMVILQYEATLDVKKLQSAVRSLIQPVTERAKYDHDFRVASPADNDRLTGYQFNSVTPYGVLVPDEIKMVLAKSIVDDTHYFWMGGGNVHLKLGLAVSDFIASTNALVADVSSPRGAGDTDFD
jgi:prolyl-tRNA editing enzyme YbaK/EbsC (Cys-tRNA(Pro) deacylase)